MQSIQFMCHFLLNPDLLSFAVEPPMAPPSPPSSTDLTDEGPSVPDESPDRGRGTNTMAIIKFTGSHRIFHI